MKPLLWAIAVFVVAGSRVGAQEMYVLPVASLKPSSLKPYPSLAPYEGKGWLRAQALGGQEKPAPAQEKPAAPKEKPAAPKEKPVPPVPAAPAPPPETDAFAQAPSLGGEAPRYFNPRMIGDFQGNFALRVIKLPGIQTITEVLTIPLEGGRRITIPVLTNQVPITVNGLTRVLVGSSSVGFKVADNQSPQPEDRVFFTYNYFNNVQGPSGPFASPQFSTRQTIVETAGQIRGTLTTTVTTLIPGAAPPRQSLNGEVMGFEKAFLDGRASIGMCAPLYQQQGDGSFSQHDFGDLSVLFNYAFFRDPVTANVLSGGLMVTAPSGPAVDTPVGNVHATVLQPFAGYRWNVDHFYLQGFTSLAVPTNPNDVTALFNDVGVGYWLYRAEGAQLLSAVVPTVEAHVTTPLNHREATAPMSGIDIVTLTGGVHLGLSNRSMLTIGVAAPVTGPRPFNVEAVAQFNFRF